MKKVVKYLLIILSLCIITGCGKEKEAKKKDNKSKNEVVVEKKVTIIDEESNTRPYAVVINNFPKATKVQAGLNKAYIIYEFPIEGGISRSLALFKDKQDVRIGTIRSARHDYLDYVLENDAIFVHYGWSKYAREDIPKLGINNIGDSYTYPFWRENPEGLATEHTVYTNLTKLIEHNDKTTKYRTTTDIKSPLKYTVDNIDFSKDEDSKLANNVEISYSGAYKIKYQFNDETKRYDRYINGNKHIDYFNQENFDTKNIIVVFIDWGYMPGADAASSKYLDLNNIGTGKGYYITNGYAKEITWEKKDRSSQTIYKYLDDTEIKVNDGNTYIMFQSKNDGIDMY